MRNLAITGLLALALCLGTDLPNEIRALFAEDVDPHVAPALTLRCDQRSANERRDCEKDLIRDFESGTREPEAIVRRHCTRFESAWSLTDERPAEICSELYGGWIES